jgi:hypothetical protein
MNDFHEIKEPSGSSVLERGRTAWSLLIGSYVSFSAILIWGNSLSGFAFSLVVGIMLGLAILAAAVGIRWLRQGGSVDRSDKRRLSAGMVIAGSVLILAVPAMYVLWILLIYEPR